MTHGVQRSRLVRRAHVITRRGLVHLRHAGSGPPIVLLHDSPRSSRLHEPLLAALSDGFKLIALDTPGYGNSTPLATGSRLEIEDFADALAETLDALGLPPCPVYGFHTSSKIALALAHRHPSRVTGVILEGLSLPAEPTSEAFIERYMKVFTPSTDGSHLVSQWSKVRDMHRFFPWFDLRAATRMPVALPDPAHLHDYSLDLFSAGEHFPDAYAAAMRYRALPAIGALTVPAVFCARPSDVLHPFLAALPKPLPAGSRVETLPDAPEAWISRLGELFAAYAGGAADDWAPADTLRADTGVLRGYRELAHGQVHLWQHRATVDPGAGGAPLLLLHDLPGAACQLQPLFAELAALHRDIVLPALPGTGDSDPLPRGSDAAAFAQALIGLADSLGIGAFEVYAQAGSAGLALRLAQDFPQRIRRVTLDGLPWFDAARRGRVLSHIAPEIAPRSDGTHLLTLWHLLRDQQMAWPWYDSSAGAIRGITPAVSAGELQATLLAVLKQLAHYGEAARAAFAEDTAAALASLRTPVVLLEDRQDLRCRFAAEAARGCQSAQLRPRPDDAQGLAELLNMPMSQGEQ
ncbi:MAG: alpha/beta fold hydrolase [Gammaproteobacteria bacterium]|nr:alpha/beta fold hydrolase [Gammaproteobacteria bacterium]